MTVVENTRVVQLHLEHKTANQNEHLGLGVATPRVSWRTETTQTNWLQTAFELELYSVEGGLLETTGKITSSESVLVAWTFKPLKSRDRFKLRLRVWDQSDTASDWSETLEVEAGLLEPSDWTARFITPDWDEDLTKAQPSPLLRHEFKLGTRVKRARLYITSLGMFEAYLNGSKVGDAVFDPGWTSYHNRLRYRTFDITNLLLEGTNTIGAMLGDGWYRGRFGFGGGRRNIYGERSALLAQLEVEYEDGKLERILSNEAWRSSTGAILTSDIYDGETYDARLEVAGWNKANFNDSAWHGVRVLEQDLSILESPIGPPVRAIEERKPVSITSSPSGKTLVDFGQNLVGWIRIVVRGKAGQTITLRHAEVLEHGELGTRPLRHAAQTDHYTLRGDDLETWQPSFTFHGFRYVEVEGWSGTLEPEHLCAVVLHSDMERTGWFECSEPMLNQLHQNIIWSMRGNFLDLPTDCPQRDERLGWTGDIQVFAPTASFLYDCAGFLESWLADLKAEQYPDGNVPFIIPNVIADELTAMTAWADAAVIVPWVLYQRFGDVGILEKQFNSMKAWVDYLDRLTGERRLWDTGFQFGDWLDPSAPPENPSAAKSPAPIVATAYFARSADLLAQSAQVLGKLEQATHYGKLAEEVRQAFLNEYVTANGRVLSDATTTYSMALEFNLLRDPKQREHAGKRLVQLVADSGHRISTGFVGTPIICDALTQTGGLETAYRLILQRACPSWLYPVTMGATTIWERWDSMLPDGSINPGEMTSFNHYALGAVADWLHRTVAGLAPAAPGYKKLEIKPQLGGDLTQARASHITPYGRAEAHWQIEGTQFKLEVIVPPNTTASITLPGQSQTLEVGSGTHQYAIPYTPPPKTLLPLSLEMSEAELFQDTEAHTLAVEVLRRHDPNSVTTEGRLPATGSISLKQVMIFTVRSGELQAKLGTALMKLNQDRSSS